MPNPVEQARAIGHSTWFDIMRRGLVTSGELKRLVSLGVSGLTSNPTIFEKAIVGSTDYDEALVKLTEAGKGVDDIYDALSIEDIQSAADLLRPYYERSRGADGFASLEVSPSLAYETAKTVAEARRLFTALGRPNVMIKVPATPQGVPAVRELIGQGINVNITLIFSLEAYRQVIDAYIQGLEDLARRGGEVRQVASVASFFLSRVDTLADKLLQEKINAGDKDAATLLGKAAIANARTAYRIFQEEFEGPRFQKLKKQGARVQRPLWASTSTKNPAYDELMYVETLIGPHTINTLPPATLTTFLETGEVRQTLPADPREAATVLAAIEKAGVSMEQVTAQLLDEGVKAFEASFEKLLQNVAEKRRHLLAHAQGRPLEGLGPLRPNVEAKLEKLAGDDLVGRMWRKDYTLWKPQPTEITDRMGWLNVTQVMESHATGLKAFAAEVRDAGYQHVVLMGMGGSSLGPEVLRQTFGSAQGYPELIVLDSTVPASVQAVTERIDPARTLFLASSKSGSTIEVDCFYRHFRQLVQKTADVKKAGRSFVAITDPGTPLEKLAAEKGFRRTFLNPADIGGRYSVLSYFGLVPAALMGLDLEKLLDRAERVREACASCVPCLDNPGAWLGAAMGVLALEGRDKLTLIASPKVESFGLWVEQLIAESTGKEGKGIVPVAGEPVLGPQAYGNDRLFVYLRLEGDDNAKLDGATETLRAAGHPLLRWSLRDTYDLGGEFFRWEFATAVAGAVMGINPYDQPNVQQAKDLTGQVLETYRREGSLPAANAPSSARALLARARPGDYFAIHAYVRQTPETDRGFAALRRQVMAQRQVATTLGYGPRFLHSTGQLHKGGPATGLFLQVVADDGLDIQVPGKPFDFGVLAAAQALGDLTALKALGRRVARVKLAGNPESFLET